MEKIELSSPSYWEAPGVDIRLNPRLGFVTEGLAPFVSGELGLDSAVVFATSGSGGSGPKFVILEKRALLASAAAVNRHLAVSKDDRWLCALTTFHVGGVGVSARAHLAGCRVFEIDGEHWDKTGSTFAKGCQEQGITLTALTPAHLHDVVENGHAAPKSLRGILIGGDALNQTLLSKALRLGWPILRTYGMTEAASQIATDEPGVANAEDRPESLPVLTDWEARAGDAGRLEIRGAPLFHAYANRDLETGCWTAEPAISTDGFFATGDRVRLDESATGWRVLSFLGRVDDLVKKLGEQVSLTELREKIRRAFPGRSVTILARSHPRLGSELVAVIEGNDFDAIREGIGIFDESVAPYERIDSIFTIDCMPRTGIGKIGHGRLAEALDRGLLEPLPGWPAPS